MIIPLQAATLGHIPGGPYCVATMGLLKCGRTRGGRVRRFKLPKLGRVEVECPDSAVDVTYLEVLVSALSTDMARIRERVIDEIELQEVEKEILMLLGMLDE